MPRFEPTDLSEVPLDELVELLGRELERDVRQVLTPIAHEHLYVLALCIGNRATSVYVTANTEEHLLTTVSQHGDPSDPFWRWDCPGDWAIIEDRSLKDTNAFLSDLERSHDAWLWGFDREERFARSEETWPVLRSRLVDAFHGALRRVGDLDLLGMADQDSCVVCLLALDDPEFTRWSAQQLSRPSAFDREFGAAPGGSG